MPNSDRKVWLVPARQDIRVNGEECAASPVGVLIVRIDISPEVDCACASAAGRAHRAGSRTGVCDGVDVPVLVVHSFNSACVVSEAFTTLNIAQISVFLVPSHLTSGAPVSLHDIERVPNIVTRASATRKSDCNRSAYGGGWIDCHQLGIVPVVKPATMITTVNVAAILNHIGVASEPQPASTRFLST